MTPARFINALLVSCLLSASLQSCAPIGGSSSSLVSPQSGKEYAAIVEGENNIDALEAGWQRNKVLQIGESPGSMLEHGVITLNLSLGRTIWNSRESIQDDEVLKTLFKNAYMELIRSHGLAAALIKTGYFTDEDLVRLARDKRYRRTLLFDRLLAKGKGFTLPGN